MSEITDLSTTDASNTSVTGYSTVGSIANMGTTDNLIQAILGLLKRAFRANLFRVFDQTDATKQIALDLSGITTATTRTAKMANHDGMIGGYTRGADIASAATLTLGTDGDYFSVTGTTGITQINASGVTIGTRVLLEFASTVLLTHSANLVLPEGTSFTTATGDRGVFVKTPTSNVWLCESFTRATNPAQTIVALSGSSAIDVTIPDWANTVELAFYNMSGSATAAFVVFLADAGGVENTGYLGTLNAAGTASALSTNFALTPNVGAGSVVFGTFTLKRMSTLVWTASSRLGFSDTPYFSEMAGGKATDQTTTSLRLAVGSGTFDSGSVRAFFSR